MPCSNFNHSTNMNETFWWCLNLGRGSQPAVFPSGRPLVWGYLTASPESIIDFNSDSPLNPLQIGCKSVLSWPRMARLHVKSWWILDHGTSVCETSGKNWEGLVISETSWNINPIWMKPKSLEQLPAFFLFTSKICFGRTTPSSAELQPIQGEFPHLKRTNHRRKFGS